MNLESGRHLKKLTPDHLSAESIKSAAIRMQSGEIFIGQIHADAVTTALQKYREEEVYGHYKSGFLTSTDRFVDREEALKIAENAKQLKEPRHEYSGRLLDSDDLKTRKRKNLH